MLRAMGEAGERVCVGVRGAVALGREEDITPPTGSLEFPGDLDEALDSRCPVWCIGPGRDSVQVC